MMAQQLPARPKNPANNLPLQHSGVGQHITYGTVIYAQMHTTY